jgi:hypothetical protein
MSETAAAETATTETAGATDATATAAPDLTAEVEKWKALSRKNEATAKANVAAAKELETFKASQMTEQEKAVAEAVAKATADTRTATLREMGAELVDAAVTAAAAGRAIDVTALLDGLDRSRFLTEDGKADSKAITAWIDKLAPADTSVDIGQGVRGTAKGSTNDPLTSAVKAKLGI